MPQSETEECYKNGEMEKECKRNGSKERQPEREVSKRSTTDDDHSGLAASLILSHHQQQGYTYAQAQSEQKSIELNAKE